MVHDAVVGAVAKVEAVPDLVEDTLEEAVLEQLKLFPQEGPLRGGDALPL